jgi:5'-methylthioadenosine phosphorylase
MQEVELAVIGGSGLYDMPGLAEVEQIRLDTPFGDPSGPIIVGSLHGSRLAFLPRHGPGHTLTPSEVPYRANIYALKQLGVRFAIGVSACGSLREDLEPGHVVVPDQLIDFTKGKRDHTFFGRGLVAHVGVAQPFSPELSAIVVEAVRSSGGAVHKGGSYVTIEGPRFSTRGESFMYRQLGMSIVGMTTTPEAFLAAEAEIAYACMAHVTDYDVWHDSEEPVTVESVIRVLSANTKLAQEAIGRMALDKDKLTGSFAAHRAMEEALGLVSDWSKISPELLAELRPIIGRYLPGAL